MKRPHLLGGILTAALAVTATGVRPLAQAEGVADPCASAPSSSQHAGQPGTPEGAPGAARKSANFRDAGRWDRFDGIWSHRSALATGRVAASAPDARNAVAGEIAVLQDGGDLVIRPNPFDLAGSALRFTPDASGGYDVARINPQFRSTLGMPVALSDDDTKSVELGFAVTFFGARYERAFLNSDGNITFGVGDNASTGRTVSRLLGGPPRVAPFLADLDPSVAGRVFAGTAGDAITFTWCGVRGFESRNSVTAQASLLPDGAIEFVYGSAIGLREAVVGLSPGSSTAFQPLDLSADGVQGGGAGAVGEASSPRRRSTGSRSRSASTRRIRTISTAS